MALRTRYSATEAAFVDADAKLHITCSNLTPTQTKKTDLLLERLRKTNTRVPKAGGIELPQQCLRALMGRSSEARVSCWASKRICPADRPTNLQVVS
jgi:hypothetical protein